MALANKAFYSYISTHKTMKQTRKTRLEINNKVAIKNKSDKTIETFESIFGE